MLDKLIEKQAAEMEAIFDEDILPTNKKAVIALIDLRTKVVIQGVVIKISLAINTAFFTALILRFFLR